MVIDALVPVKGTAAGKERLAPAMPPAARAALVVAMLRDVVEALLAVPALRFVWVTSPDTAMLTQAAAWGARPLPEQPSSGGLNAALAAGLAHLGAAGAAGVLIVQADLPAITTAAVEALLTPPPAGAGLRAAPTADGGTSALLLCPPDAIAPHFGEDSFARHAAAAAAAGLRFCRVESPALARDLDRPEDLASLPPSGAGRWTRRALALLTAERAPR